MTEALATSPLAHAIGLALLQFVWQGAAIGAVTALVLVTLRRSSAQARYAVACAGLAVMVAVPVVTVAGEWRDRARVEANDTRLRIAPGAVANVTSPGTLARSSQTTTPSAIPVWLEARLPLVVLFWSGGVLLLALHLLRGWMRIGLIQRHARVLERDEWPDAVRRLADRLGITRRVRLIESTLMEVPAVIGCLRPAIVVPASALAGLPPAYLEAILAHELAHVRRGDYLINVLQSVVEVLLFYHPAVWWLSKQIRLEREHCCDDVAASLCADRVSYAEALVSLEELRGATPALAMAATGGDLLHRVRRLVEPGSASGPTFSGRFAMCVALTVLLIAVSGHMQELPAGTERPEVATLQPVAAPVSTTSIAPAAEPTLDARRATPTPLRTATPAPAPAPAPAPEPETRTVAAAPTDERASQSAIAGAVKDQQGGVIPGATVTVTSPTSSAKNTTVTNTRGEFNVSAVPGLYDVAVSLPGFRYAVSRLEVVAGQTVTAVFVLDIGSLSEVITVLSGGGKEGAAPAAPSATPIRAPRDPKTSEELLDAAAFYYQQKQFAEAKAMMDRALAILRPTSNAQLPSQPPPALRDPDAPVRVGGSIKEPKKIRDVKPVYPADAEAAGVTGIVIVEATIAKDGFVNNARVLRSVPMLDEAALGAVRQWRFTPTLLNGVPVEVVMTVTVSFGSR